MTRNANYSMRKMAVTGLTLIGMVLGSLGTLGCDEFATAPLGSAGYSGAHNPIRLTAMSPEAETSKVIRGLPPRSRIIDPGPPRR